MTDKKFDDTNRGVLFRRSRKDDDSPDKKYPDYTGAMNVHGRDHWLSAWIKTDKNGNKYMSLSINPKDEKPGAVKPTTKAQRDEEMDGDEIPF